MQTVTLKMEDSLLEEIDSTLAKHRYSTRTEFMRDAIRCKLTAFEKEEAIRKLAAYKGFLKGKARMSEEQAKEEAFQELKDELETGKKDVAYERLVKKLGIRSK
ncbi:MAG: ribbon-helix-helix domain-containing protein [Candidatus Nanoarchaeia archaeon]|jgi:metal-responsive CopG/Arc/MetJ family transcriptional regulator